MTCPIGVFDARNVIVTVTSDGVAHRVQGFGDGDYVTVEPVTEQATIQTGADGFHVANFNANNGHNITITLSAQSASARVLRQFSRLGTQFAISIRSPDTNEHGYSDCAIITNKPSMRFGTEAGTREFSIFAGDWQEDGVITA